MMYIILTFFLAFTTADFITGIIHFIEDTYFTENTLLIGNIIKRNREHHLKPRLMLNHTTFKTIETSLYLGLFLMFVLYIYKLLNLFSFLLILSGIFGNLIHKWAHQMENEKILLTKILQNLYIIQSSYQHSVHHKEPYTKYYCVMGALLNPLLEKINFWRKMENVIYILFKVNPRDYEFKKNIAN